jgi:hypothetical protein
MHGCLATGRVVGRSVQGRRGEGQAGEMMPGGVGGERDERAVMKGAGYGLRGQVMDSEDGVFPQ